MSALPKSFPPSVYSLFLRGFDTATIADRLKRPEHEIVHELTVEWSRAKGVTAEFEPSPYRKSRVKRWLAIGNPHLGPLP